MLIQDRNTRIRLRLIKNDGRASHLQSRPEHLFAYGGDSVSMLSFYHKRARCAIPKRSVAQSHGTFPLSQ